jgi:hypothetical protein
MSLEGSQNIVNPPTTSIQPSAVNNVSSQLQSIPSAITNAIPTEMQVASLPEMPDFVNNQPVPSAIAPISEPPSSSALSSLEDMLPSKDAFDISDSFTKGSFGFSDFMESNSLIMKFSFLMLTIITFVFFFKLGTMLINYFYNNSDSVVFFDGSVDAKQQLIFTQDPADANAVTVYRSVNMKEGIEFTWSVWIFIEDLQYNGNKYRHIFHKGSNENVNGDLLYMTNAPGMYIKPNSNTIVVMMNTYNIVNQEVEVPDIPLNKWVNIIIRCQNTQFDIYVNGVITRSLNLLGLPKQNYGNTFVSMNGGFDGFISNLTYYAYACSVSEIQKIVNNQPNTTIIGNSGYSDTLADYLSLRWYL